MDKKFHSLWRIVNAGVAVILVFVLFGNSGLHPFLGLASLLAFFDAWSSKSSRGKTADGIAALGLLDLFLGFGIPAPFSSLFIVYAIASFAANAWGSYTLRQRFHTA